MHSAGRNGRTLASATRPPASGCMHGIEDRSLSAGAGKLAVGVGRGKTRESVRVDKKKAGDRAKVGGFQWY